MPATHRDDKGEADHGALPARQHVQPRAPAASAAAAAVLGRRLAVRGVPSRLCAAAAVVRKLQLHALVHRGTHLHPGATASAARTWLPAGAHA